MIEIDQSGKIEQTWLNTVLAFSNKHQYSILIPKKLKQTIIKKHKQKQTILKIFIIGLYYLLENYLHENKHIIIDNEYEGKQNYIKSSLLSLIRKKYPKFNKDLISISNISSNSKAHEVAINIQRKHIKPQKTLNQKDILKFLSGGSKKSKPASTMLFTHRLARHPSYLIMQPNHYLNLSVKELSHSKDSVNEVNILKKEVYK